VPDFFFILPSVPYPLILLNWVADASSSRCRLAPYLSLLNFFFFLPIFRAYFYCFPLRAQQLTLLFQWPVAAGGQCVALFTSSLESQFVIGLDPPAFRRGATFPHYRPFRAITPSRWHRVLFFPASPFARHKLSSSSVTVFSSKLLLLFSPA